MKTVEEHEWEHHRLTASDVIFSLVVSVLLVFFAFPLLLSSVAFWEEVFRQIKGG